MAPTSTVTWNEEPGWPRGKVNFTTAGFADQSYGATGSRFAVRKFVLFCSPPQNEGHTASSTIIRTVGLGSQANTWPIAMSSVVLPSSLHSLFSSHPLIDRICMVLVGLVDGDADGLVLGSKVGDVEGEVDGLTDGLPLGAAVGLALGLPEGVAEGVTLGDTVGAREGVALGDAVGAVVGREGRAEGAAVGDTLGDDVGA